MLKNPFYFFIFKKNENVYKRTRIIIIIPQPFKDLIEKISALDLFFNK